VELSVGQTARRELAVTAAMVERYAEITGDRNPLHFDEAFAGAVFTKQNWAFPKPVYIGDTIRAEAVVLRVHARMPMADLGFTVTNQREETVLTGEATIYQASPEPRC
jgi:acyl dehydratase